MISTHILDTTAGKPAADVKVDLTLNNEIIESLYTNSDGRLVFQATTLGTYTLLFHINSHFTNSLYPFISITVNVTGKIHVPLLVTPFSYTTYRGS
jgi:hydroxyisourate hydrolase